MDTAPVPDVTALLSAWKQGDAHALEELMSVLYGELRRTARHYMQLERAGHTLQTTALVNEAYLRLAGAREINYNDRVHFFAFAAQMMRRVLVDHARSCQSLKRGAGEHPIALDDCMIGAPDRSAQVEALDDALSELAKHDERKARMVELRFFGGLSVEETATALGVSQQTVLRDWTLAKAWLMRYMGHA